MLGITLVILYTAIFIVIIRRNSFFRVEGIPKNIFIGIFFLKIFFGTALWALYSFYPNYQNRADVFMYFDDGLAIYKALYEHPIAYFKILLGFNDPALNTYIDNTGHWNMMYVQGLYNETRTIIRFNAIADIFSFGNYHVHTVFICFLSLFGLTGIYKSFLPYLKNKKKELLVIIFLLPTVLFWGSGVLKEGLLLFFMGMLIYYYFKILQEGVSITRIVLCLLFAWMLAVTKLYMLLILLPAMIALYWINATNNKMPELKFIVVLAACFALVIPFYDLPFKLMDKQQQSIYMASGGTLIGQVDVHKYIYISPDVKTGIKYLPDKPGYCKIVEGTPYISWYFEDYTDTVIVAHSTDTATYWVYYQQSKAGSYIDIPLLYTSYSSVLKNAPHALLTTIFRPKPSDVKNSMMLIAAIENFCILLFILLCMLFIKKKIENRQLIYFCLLIAIILFVLTGLTTPILGAIVRYKMPALPFFLISFLLLLNKAKLLHKLPFLKKILG